MSTDGTTPVRTRRGSRLRRRLSVAIAVVVSLAIAFIIYSKSRFLPNRVSEYVNEHYLSDTPFEFSCGRISGDFVNRVVIENPTLRYHSRHASFNVFRADEIAVDYRLLDVLKFDLIVDDLRAHNVRLQIRQDDDGKLVLPLPPAGEPQPAGSTGGARVDVQRFEIDGLQVLFGGERELAVRDVNLAGAFGFENGVGHLEIDQGSAYLANTGTSVSSIRMDVEHQGGDVTVREFVARLDQSFVMATGGYHDGAFRRLQLVFNPISLDEVHLLGLIPDLHGEFGGNVIFDGPVDSLAVSGQVTGTGLGLVLGALSFDGTARADAIRLAHVDGDVFGSHLRGAFTYRLQGDPDFTFDGTCAGLDLTQGFVPDSGLPATDLNGRARVVYAAATDTYRIDAELDSATVGDYQARQTTFRGAWSPERGLVIDEARLERPGYAVDIDGRIDPAGSADLLFRAAGKDLSYFWEFAHIPPIGGEIAVSGRAVGPVDDLRINVNGDARDVRFLFATVDSARVSADVRGVGGKAPSAIVDVTGHRLTMHGRNFENPHVRVDASANGPAFVRDFSFSHGDTTVSADLEVTPHEGGAVSVVVRHAAIVDSTDAWRLMRPARLRVVPGELEVDSLVLASNAGRIGVTGAYSEARRVVDVVAWGNNVDVGMIPDATGSPLHLRGRGAFHLEAHGDVDAPLVECRAQLGRGEVDSLSFDRVELAATYDGKEYALRRFHLVDGADSVDVSGWWRTTVSPVRIVRGEADYPAMTASPFHADVDAHGYSLASLGRALHRPLALGGALDGRVALDGTPDDPRIRIAADVSPRPGFALALPHGRIDASYADGVATVTSLALHGDVDATVSGTVPLRVSLTRGAGIDRDAPLALDLRIRQTDAVARLGGYWNRLTTLDGRFRGDLTVRGTIAAPRFGGELAMDGGVVQVAGMVERFQDASARVKFVDNVVRLASIDATSNRGGTVHGSGQVVLDGWSPGSYRIDLAMSDFWLHSIPNMESLQDGQLTVSSIEWEDGRRIPNITGKVMVKEASLQHVLDTGGGTQRASLTLPTSEPAWVCSIDLDAPKNVWIRDPDLRTELGGNLILKRDETGMYLRGELNVLRGQYTVYGNKFQIIDGSLNFSTALLRPEIQINAYTPHRTEGGFERRIYLSLSWPHDKKEPTVTLSYDEPGYYEQDIWRMLGGTDIAGGIAANALERVLNEQMSDVSIEIGKRDTQRQSQLATPEQEMMIGVGKYLWQDVYLRYRQGLTLTTSREVDVEYRLSNMLLIRSELVRYTRRNYVGANRQTLDEFNLDIRLRWEF